MRHIIFLLLLSAAACKHQPNPCDQPTKTLEETLPGKWELAEVKGWPHSSDKFVPVPDNWSKNKLTIGEDGSFQHTDNPKTTYQLKLRDNETFLCPSDDDYGWAITEFDNCILVFRLDGSDEGPFWMKYRRD